MASSTRVLAILFHGENRSHESAVIENQG